MKTHTFLFWLFSPVYLLAQPTTTNTPALPGEANESWISISNRWSPLTLDQVKKASAKGDLSAEYYLGNVFLSGNGVPKDPVEGVKLIRHAADQGYAKARQHLGFLYARGDGVPQDYAVAAKLYRLAAEQGNARAQNNLGYLYYTGQGVPQDGAEALKWYRKAAENGDEFGQSNLGWAYQKGEGVERDYHLAEKWMREAAEQGRPDFQYRYGNLLENEFDKDGHQIANFAVAAEWYRKAADNGHAKAQFALAELYHGGNLGDDQRPKCIPWYLKAAAQGNAEAKAVIGQLPQFYPGNQLLKQVDITGMLRESAEEGNLDAQYALAHKYASGDGVSKDPVEAFKWMQRAADNPAPSSRVGDAAYELGVMYEKGVGTAPNLSAAHQLYLAAATGYRQPEAAARVGQMFEAGEGVPQDDHKAASFYANVNVSSDHVFYAAPGPGAIEKLLKLWSSSRGFPTAADTAQPGYHAPADLLDEWKGYLTTATSRFYVGEIYYQGKLLPKDVSKAVDCFNQAAKQGSAEAMNRIGELWAAGTMGEPDPKEAATWYRKAANKGLPQAQLNLGRCCAKGEGVSLDKAEAWKWLQLAANQNCPNAADEREKIQRSMTADELNQARSMADSFRVTGSP
jgi:TPR repeat protein